MSNLVRKVLFAAADAQWGQQYQDFEIGDLGWAVSIDGDYAIAGAPEDNTGGSNAGAAYIYFRSSGTLWTQQAKLTASDAAADDRFGYSVSISGDYAIVGALGDDDGGSNSGSAYVFVRSGTSWSQQAKLTASDAGSIHAFGRSVSIDGEYAIIGANNNDAAYVFVRSGTSWSEQAKLTSPDTSSQFGYAVSIDGDYAVVGDYGYFGDRGSAYVFVRSGTSWTYQATLTASDGAFDDYFGWTVSIDGDYVIVGAYGDDDGGSDSGSAYVFVRSGTSWSQQAKLTASDAAANDYFGYSVSIDGDYAVVGAYLADGGASGSGSAYVFARSGTSWSHQAKLTASDATLNDRFGRSVSISGEYAMIGAPNNNAAYIFVEG